MSNILTSDQSFTIHGSTLALDGTMPTLPPPANKGLRIAGVFSGSLYRDLRLEARLLPLGENDGPETLELMEPDLLLVDVCERSFDGGWAFWPHLPHRRRKVLDLMAASGRSDIPSVLWAMVDASEDYLLDEIGDITALVACFDPGLYRSMRERGANSLLLPIAVQDRIFHPNRGDTPCTGRPILLDGLVDVLRHPRNYRFLSHKEARHIRLIDSNFLVATGLAAGLQRQFTCEVAGHVPPEIWPWVLRAHRVLLLTQDGHYPPLVQLRQMIEALACGLSVLSASAMPERFNGSPSSAALKAVVFGDDNADAFHRAIREWSEEKNSQASRPVRLPAEHRYPAVLREITRKLGVRYT